MAHAQLPADRPGDFEDRNELGMLIPPEGQQQFVLHPNAAHVPNHEAPIPPQQQEVPAPNLLDIIRELSLDIRTQNLSSQIRKYDGQSAKHFKAWLRELERISNSAGVANNGERKIAFAFQTLTGLAGDFMNRIVRLNPHITWDQLKDRLVAKFSDNADMQYKREKLRRLKQNEGESVQLYGERLLNAAEDIYVDINNAERQLELAQIFTDGILSDEIARKIMERNFNTLDQVLTFAVRSQQAARNFRLRRCVDSREESEMEVDHVQQSKRPEGDIDKLTRLLTEFLSKTQLNSSRPDRRKFTDQGRPICLHCNAPGHIKRNCFKLHPELKSKSNETSTRSEN